MAKISNPFPKRLKEARVLHGISQKKLGIAIGIDEFSASARMNQYETGKHFPDYLTIFNISAFLKLPVSYFFEPNDEISGLIVKYSSLTKAQRNSLQKYINKFSE